MAVAAAVCATYAAILSSLPGWRAARDVALVALQAQSSAQAAARSHP